MIVRRRRALVGVAAFLVLIVIATVAAVTLAPRSLLLIAHRGDINPADGLPEDTLAALDLAVARGADGIEFDVQRSADGTLWLLHDTTVDRTTDGTGKLADLRDAQIAALTIDGGLGWRAGLDGQHLTRLSELADRGVAARAGHLFVDLKDDSDALATSVVAWLAGGGWTAKAEVNVKTHGQATIVHAAGITVTAQPDWIPDALAAPDVDVVLVWGDQLEQALRLRPAGQIELFRHPISEAGRPEAPLIARARQLGLRAFLTDDVEAAREPAAGASP